MMTDSVRFEISASNTRYIEFDSNYRDRKLYPLASNFIVEMSQSSQGDRFNARDPVSEASPVLIWNNNFINGNTYSNLIANLSINPYNSLQNSNQGNTVYMLYSASGQLRQIKNFYSGTFIQRDSAGTTPPLPLVPSGVGFRILEYNPINNNYALINIDGGIPPTGLTGYFIYDPTPIDTTTTNSEIKVFVPGSNRNLVNSQRTEHFGLGSDNYYVNYYLQNTDTGEAVRIKSFDGLTRLATLESATQTNWTGTGVNFAIRKTLPLERGDINSVVSRTEFVLNINSNNNEQVGNFLRLLPFTASGTQYSPYSPPFT
jgi:hypothetical protein